MTNMRNRPEDPEYRQQNRWMENSEDRDQDWESSRRSNFDRGWSDFDRNRGGFGGEYGRSNFGRGRRVWDQESGMYNQSPGYGRSTPAGWRASEIDAGGGSYSGWGRGGYGQYDRESFGRGGYDRGDVERGAFEHSRRFDEDSYYSPGRFDAGTYFGGGRFGDGQYGGRDYGDAYAQRGYGDEGWFHEDVGAGIGSRGPGMSAGLNRFERSGAGGGYGRRADESWRGPYTGRGPRGYTRSDERIREDVSEELQRHGWIDASDMEVRVHGGEVTLQGTVEDRSQKRMAEDLAEEVPGVKDVHNQLRVANRIGQERAQGASFSGERTPGSTEADKTENNRTSAAAQR